MFKLKCFTCGEERFWGFTKETLSGKESLEAEMKFQVYSTDIETDETTAFTQRQR